MTIISHSNLSYIRVLPECPLVLCATICSYNYYIVQRRISFETPIYGQCDQFIDFEFVRDTKMSTNVTISPCASIYWPDGVPFRREVLRRGSQGWPWWVNFRPEFSSNFLILSTQTRRFVLSNTNGTFSVVLCPLGLSAMGLIN